MIDTEYGYVDGDMTGTWDGIIKIVSKSNGKEICKVAMGDESDTFLSLNDCLKEIEYNPNTDGTVTVIIDSCLAGDVYIYGNYVKGQWYRYGRTMGFA